MVKPWTNTYSLLKAIGASSAVIDETWRDYRRKYMRSQRWQDIRTVAIETPASAATSLIPTDFEPLSFEPIDTLSAPKLEMRIRGL